MVKKVLSGGDICKNTWLKRERNHDIPMYDKIHYKKKKKKKKESTWEKNLLVRENSTCMGNAWSVWETARFLWPKETVEEEEVVEIADETESWRVLWEHWILIQNSVKI